MTESELKQAKAQRLMILGAITELAAEEQVRIDQARAAILEAIEPFGDQGKLALMIVTLDAGIAEGVDE